MPSGILRMQRYIAPLVAIPDACFFIFIENLAFVYGARQLANAGASQANLWLMAIS